MNSKLVYLFVLTIILSACSKKNLERTEEKATEGYTLSQALDEYERHTLDFDTFSAKAKCKYEDEDRNLSFTTNLRVKKDEIIWVSATMFGIEGARAYITPETVQVINRLERSYYSESIEKLQEISGLPVDFYMLQNMITGKILLINDGTTINQKDGSYQLQTALEDIFSIAFLDEANFLMTRQNVTDDVLNSEMDIIYSDYQSVGQFDFPYESSVHVTGEKEIKVELDVSSVELNKDLSFPFNINKNYERKAL